VVASFNNKSIIGYNTCVAKSYYYYSSTTVLEAETIGLLEAIKVAISDGMCVVRFETDFKSIFDALATTNTSIKTKYI
jgi:hypothetical protein